MTCCPCLSCFRFVPIHTHTLPHGWIAPLGDLSAPPAVCVSPQRLWLPCPLPVPSSPCCSRYLLGLCEFLRVCMCVCVHALLLDPGVFPQGLAYSEHVCLCLLWPPVYFQAGLCQGMWLVFSLCGSVLSKLFNFSLPQALRHLFLTACPHLFLLLMRHSSLVPGQGLSCPFLSPG